MIPAVFSLRAAINHFRDHPGEPCIGRRTTSPSRTLTSDDDANEYFNPLNLEQPDTAEEIDAKCRHNID